jgi:hypothetical protein
MASSASPRAQLDQALMVMVARPGSRAIASSACCWSSFARIGSPRRSGRFQVLRESAKPFHAAQTWTGHPNISWISVLSSGMCWKLT